MKRIAMLAALALAQLFPAPAQTRAAAPPPLTAADTNRIIAVRVGRIVTVQLRQSAGTGSSWRMVPAAGMIQVGPPIVAPTVRDGPAMVGAPELHVFRVRITAPGQLALTFVNARTFGGADQRAESATFVLEAK